MIIIYGVYGKRIFHQAHFEPNVVSQEKSNNVLMHVVGDVGGFMGLLLGASALTVFELIDLVIMNFAKKLHSEKKRKAKEQARMEHLKMAIGNDGALECQGSGLPPSDITKPDVDPDDVHLQENPSNGPTDYGFANNYNSKYWQKKE